MEEEAVSEVTPVILGVTPPSPKESPKLKSQPTIEETSDEDYAEEEINSLTSTPHTVEHQPRTRPRGVGAPWSPPSRPSVTRQLSFSSAVPIASTVAESDRRPPNWVKERSHVPYGHRYLGEGYSLDKHVRANASKIACDLADARNPPFLGRSTSEQVPIDTERFRSGRCPATPAALGYPEWGAHQLQVSWATPDYRRY